jgi:hypothetical protein
MATKSLTFLSCRSSDSLTCDNISSISGTGVSREIVDAEVATGAGVGGFTGLPGGTAEGGVATGGGAAVGAGLFTAGEGVAAGVVAGGAVG